ncbi:PTS sugar transporter subunit IIA [bacterium]|nr:PTS sugar transporter subunit IIA [bacterium]
MQLVEALKGNLIALDFKAEGKDDVIESIVKAVEVGGYVADANGLRNALVEREKLGTTGVGGGVAIPHARCTAINDVTVAFFRSTNGVNFNSIDNKPVFLMFVLLAPLSSSGDYLKLLAKISRLLRHDEFRNALMEAQTPGEILEIVQEHE